MSTIVLMTDNSDVYKSGEIYRVRSRNAEELFATDQAVEVEQTKLDPNNPNEHEGV